MSSQSTRRVPVQDAGRGDVLTRTDSEGRERRFRVRHGEYSNPADNIVVYLGNPSEDPIPAEMYFDMEKNEATIMYWEAEDGSLHTYDPS